MKNRLAWKWGVISLAVSLIFTFNAPRFMSIIITWAGFFIILYCISLSAGLAKGKKYAKAFLSALPALITLYLFYYRIFVLGYWTNPQEPHFRSLLGGCSYVTAKESWHGPDPWYYKRDCDIPPEEKIRMITERGDYEYVAEDCLGFCSAHAENMFCDESGYMPIRCDYIVECDAITCP